MKPTYFGIVDIPPNLIERLKTTDVVTFEGRGEYNIVSSMAPLNGKIVELEKILDRFYAFKCSKWLWHKDWLRNVQEISHFYNFGPMKWLDDKIKEGGSIEFQLNEQGGIAIVSNFGQGNGDDIFEAILDLMTKEGKYE